MSAAACLSWTVVVDSTSPFPFAPTQKCHPHVNQMIFMPWWRDVGAASTLISALVYLANRLVFLFRLEPLLARIGEDRTAVVCPIIDVISSKTLDYNGGGGHSVGGFWWSLHFSWRPLPEREKARRKSRTDPIRYFWSAKVGNINSSLRATSFFPSLASRPIDGWQWIRHKKGNCTSCVVLAQVENLNSWQALISPELTTEEKGKSS